MRYFHFSFNLEAKSGVMRAGDIQIFSENGKFPTRSGLLRTIEQFFGCKAENVIIVGWQGMTKEDYESFTGKTVDIPDIQAQLNEAVKALKMFVSYHERTGFADINPQYAVGLAKQIIGDNDVG